MNFHVCSCNRSMPVDASALGMALDAPVTGHGALCRRELGEFAKAASADEPLTVACTQEAALFAQTSAGVRPDRLQPLRFVNIRERAGWSADAKRGVVPKMAALLAEATLPPSEPLPSFTYRSRGRTLVIGPADEAFECADQLATELDVTVLITGPGAVATRPRTAYATASGMAQRIAGWLGAFTVEWTQRNPIDLEACVRCNACIDACPEGAIDFSYQVDLDACRSHRACVVACGDARAIDFDRGASPRTGRFDVVLDLRPESARRDAPRDLPQGWLAPGPDVRNRERACAVLRTLVGEFEKPRFFGYDANTCAHARSGVAGCTRCIDVCSTAAIRSAGDRVHVEPALCMGCGACASACPTGAMTYKAPTVPDLGMRIKAMLEAYRRAGGTAPALLIADAAGVRRVDELGALARTGSARGLPADLVPLEVLHVASFGPDATLAAIAAGAARIRFLPAPGTAPAYIEMLRDQAALIGAILDGLGYPSAAVVDVIDAADARALDVVLNDGLSSRALAPPAPFAWQTAKRATLSMAIEHLHRHSPRAAQPGLVIPLAAAAPFGDVAVDPAKCTLCMSCVGACPASALAAGQDTPELRFVEANCVQCGLCERTCPEQAITLVPRLAIGPDARAPRVIARTRPFECIRCGKPFGTARMIEAMLAKIGSHGAFAGHLDRLRMCGDCRVFDVIADPGEARIASPTELRRPGEVA